MEQIDLGTLPRTRKERYQQDPEYRELVKQRARESYARNALKRRAQKAEYRQANQESVKAAKRRYQQENRDKCNAAKRRWLEVNREKAALHAWRANRRRRARRALAASPLPISALELKARVEMLDGCAYCGMARKLTVEHFLPISKGGMHLASNILGACERCNKSKQDADPEQWFRAQPFFTEKRWRQILKAVGKTNQHHGQLALL